MSGTAPRREHTFVTMDALRGVAALCVVEFHAIGLSATLFRHAYLAVDFFFLLSGFVLSYAYGDRLDKGWSTWTFLKTRWIRLWPLNTLGLLLGFALALMGVSVIKVHVTMAQHWLYLPLNLFFIPVDLRSPEFPMFPYNTACWSLFFELFSNAIHAIFFRRMRTPLLVLLSALCGALYVWRVCVAGTANIGLQVNSIDGYVRVLFPYTVGMLFFRVWRSGRGRMRISAPMVLVALALVLILPVPHSMSTAYDLFCILLVLPAVVYASIYAGHGALYERLLQSLGNVSYGIYILQFPVILACQWFWRTIFHRDANHARPFLGLAVFPLLLLLTVAANRWIDEPVRRWLRLKFHA